MSLGIELARFRAYWRRQRIGVRGGGFSLHQPWEEECRRRDTMRRINAATTATNQDQTGTQREPEYFGL